MAQMLIEVDKGKVQAAKDALSGVNVSEFPEHDASDGCVVLRLDMSDDKRDELLKQDDKTGERSISTINKSLLPASVSQTQSDRLAAMEEQLKQALAQLAAQGSAQAANTPVAGANTPVPGSQG